MGVQFLQTHKITPTMSPCTHKIYPTMYIQPLTPTMYLLQVGVCVCVWMGVQVWDVCGWWVWGWLCVMVVYIVIHLVCIYVDINRV